VIKQLIEELCNPEKQEYNKQNINKNSEYTKNLLAFLRKIIISIPVT
jgi:hypothetical protein